ncbi:spermidine/putrescine transport system substrate-binding protein [Plasticicumulans lactativorans]|uniref:Spermidine/putrescine transport system substrate-binding protein n=1 Tax=Plasticicumulans lactativorans TaxID=1133106 RepID=A0A4R2L437_9GAMM|nr:extracellular solute-binding protein [Plasticicumulans lactativorans]TCO81186.1 spermidine/putrescine transport system substrate-binding protein [Plasticicumulans lactativorans]
MQQLRRSGIDRRTFLKAGLAAGAVAALGPWVVREAHASSGEVRVFGWAGYFTDELLAKFRQDTGITARYTPYGTNDELLNQLKAVQGEGFDVIMPTLDRVPNYVELDLVRPIDEREAALDKVLAGPLAGSAGKAGVGSGARYLVPVHWGTEALLFDRKAAPLSYGASLGELWKPEYRGRVTVRGHSGLAGIGRWLDAQGRLPHPFSDGFRDPVRMKAIWDAILKVAIANKPSVGQFWSNGNEATAAFVTNGCVIGQNWDETAAALIADGRDIGYLAPAEGAFAWMEGFCIPKKAKNVAQAYAWINWFLDPANGAAFAAARASNSVARGADAHLPEAARRFFAAAYPGDALDRLWWWPVQEAWYVKLRNEYQDRYLAA